MDAPGNGLAVLDRLAPLERCAEPDAVRVTVVEPPTLCRLSCHAVPNAGHRFKALLEGVQTGHQVVVFVIQVVPLCWHSGMSGGFIMTDNAAYAEAVHSGQVYGNGDETVRSLGQRFDNIRLEAMRSSESLALIREMINRDRLAKVQLLKRQRRSLRRSGLG